MIRFGIVGTNFVSEWFLEACGRTGGRVVPVAVCSRDAGRARSFAAEHGLEAGYDDLADMLGVVDAVYIASPTYAHHSQAMTVIRARRHVLVEKTMARTAEETADIFQSASNRGVVAMEAARHLHTPAYGALVAALPRIGSPRYARFEKQQYSSRYDRFRSGIHVNAFDPRLGNSAIADLGVYCLEPAIDMFGAPRRTSGSSVRLANGFEAAGSLQLDYSTMLVDVVYSKIASGVGPSVVLGEDGSLSIDDIAEPSRVLLHRRGAEPEVLFDSPPVTPAATMHHELMAFAGQVEVGFANPRWAHLSLAARRLMDEHLERQ